MPAQGIIYPEVPDTPHNCLPPCFCSCGSLNLEHPFPPLCPDQMPPPLWSLPGSLHWRPMPSPQAPAALSPHPLPRMSVWLFYLVSGLPDSQAHSLLPPLSGTLSCLRECLLCPPSPRGTEAMSISFSLNPRAWHIEGAGRITALLIGNAGFLSPPVWGHECLMKAMNLLVGKVFTCMCTCPQSAYNSGTFTCPGSSRSLWTPSCELLL